MSYPGYLHCIAITHIITIDNVLDLLLLIPHGVITKKIPPLHPVLCYLVNIHPFLTTFAMLDKVINNNNNEDNDKT